MGSTFSSYNIAVSGMYVSQRGLYVTGHNISNANTPGYVRQQAMIAEYPPVNLGVGQVGLGAEIQETRQIRHRFLDNMYRNESELLGHAQARAKVVGEIETILGEPFDVGLNKVMDRFFQAWHELSKDPDSLTTRVMVRQRGVEFANRVNQIGMQLEKLQQDINTEIRLKIDDINGMATKIASLNREISLNELGDDNANDLRDQRNLLLDELSKLMDVDIDHRPNGMVNVSIGGLYLVHGENTEKIKAGSNQPGSYFVDPKWEKTDTFVNIRSGILKGLLEARGEVAGYRGSVENGSPPETGDVDSDAATFTFDPDSANIIPELRKGLNIMVNLLTRKMNEMHREGIGLDSSTGLDFFTKIDDGLPFEMGNIRVNPAFDGDDGLNKIGASLTGQLPGDNTNAERILAFRREAFFISHNSAVRVDDFYHSVITWVGTTGDEARGLAESQSVLVAQTQNKRDAISAVSMDEEMANMMKYQHAYNANAKVINAIDQMIDKVVNGMGIVGR